MPVDDGTEEKASKPAVTPVVPVLPVTAPIQTNEAAEAKTN